MEVDDNKPGETNGKPAPEPPVVETKEVEHNNTAHSAAAATKVVTEIQAEANSEPAPNNGPEAKGGCCVIL